MKPLSRVESILHSKENNEAYQVQPLSRLESQLMNLNMGGGADEEISGIKTEIENVKDSISVVAVDLDAVDTRLSMKIDDEIEQVRDDAILGG